MNIETVPVSDINPAPYNPRINLTPDHPEYKKLKQSIVATCRSLKVPDGQAEEIAALVVKGVSEWCHDKAEITSNDIRRIGATILAKYHIEAAYLYKQQLTVL